MRAEEPRTRIPASPISWERLQWLPGPVFDDAIWRLPPSRGARGRRRTFTCRPRHTMRRILAPLLAADLHLRRTEGPAVGYPWWYYYPDYGYYDYSQPLLSSDLVLLFRSCRLLPLCDPVPYRLADGSHELMSARTEPSPGCLRRERSFVFTRERARTRESNVNCALAARRRQLQWLCRLEEPPITYSRNELKRGSCYVYGWPWSGRY